MEAAPASGAAVPFPQRDHLVQLQVRIIESSNLRESCARKPGQWPRSGLSFHWAGDGAPRRSTFRDPGVASACQTRRRYAIANIAAAVLGCKLLSRANGAEARSQGALPRQRVLNTCSSGDAPHAVGIE